MVTEYLSQLIRSNGGPFCYEKPEVYSQDQHHGMHYFCVLIREGVMIFTYDDSEAFQPVFLHFFDLKDVLELIWSPLGSSLLCFKEQELILLSMEPAFKESKFHVDGKIFDVGISPQENFVFLMCRPSNQQHLKLEIRETKTGNIRKAFDIEIIKKSWVIGPINFLKWNNDDNYIASLESNSVLAVYETKTFSEVKSMIFKKVKGFSWSNSESMLAVAAESYIKIVDVFNGKLLFVSGWKGVDKCKLIWEGSGDYLVCICSSNGLNKLFLVSLKTVKGQFIAYTGGAIDFAWRGNGKDFAVTQGLQNGEPTKVKFYTIRDNEKSMRHKLQTVEGMVAHFLHWSPNGRYMVMQGSSNIGELYFYDVDHHQRLISTTFRASNLKWDSTSRYFLTQADIENEDLVVRIWSSHGEKLVDVGPFFLIMLWRRNAPPNAKSSVENITKKRLTDASEDSQNDVRRKFVDSGDLGPHSGEPSCEVLRDGCQNLINMCEPCEKDFNDV